MIYPYPSNTQHFKVEYHRVREGPNWFMMFYRNIATPCFTVRDVKGRLGSAKFLESSKNLYKWMEEMIEQYDKQQTELDMSQIAATGFGPEAHGEDPTANTRMVT